MFKQLSTLVRGKSHEAVEAVADRNAIVILRQQIRDCAESVAAARKAVAVASAQNELELAQQAKLKNRIEDLEKRAVVAMGQGKDDLARDAAETIALLEAERETSREAQHDFEREIGRLKRIVRDSEARLRELQRGQQLVSAVDKTQKLRDIAPNAGMTAMKDAEETLQRLQMRQKQIDATAAAMEEMARSGDPGSMSERLAEAGCGAPIKSSADDVLKRLAKRAKKSA